jgi:hypothetical protein
MQMRSSFSPAWLRIALHTRLPPLPPPPQASSPGSLISFVTGDAALSRAVCEGVHLFKITVSFGNVRSLIRCGAPASGTAARSLRPQR